MAVRTTLRPSFTPPSSSITPPTEFTYIEGGYYSETDRSPTEISSPFPSTPSNTHTLTLQRPGFTPSLRNLSTTIFYLLTPSGPQGGFHRNLGRTIHTLHRGRGLYILIHADSPTSPKRIETFVVGPNVSAGEKLQWIVEGGKYKASFLLPDEEEGEESEGLLISETVVPGFEFCDHDFLSREGLEELVGVDKARELGCVAAESFGEEMIYVVKFRGYIVCKTQA